jgi:hypothetical protein
VATYDTLPARSRFACACSKGSAETDILTPPCGEIWILVAYPSGMGNENGPLEIAKKNQTEPKRKKKDYWNYA